MTVKRGRGVTGREVTGRVDRGGEEEVEVEEEEEEEEEEEGRGQGGTRPSRYNLL